MTEGQQGGDVIERARQEVYNLASGKRRWTMRVPVEDTDSDVVLIAGLDAAERAATASWERDAEAASRAAHEAWKVWIVACGYADHRFPAPGRWSWGSVRAKTHAYRFCNDCNRREEFHHPDMVPWDELPEAKRGKYRVMAKAGYMVAAQRGDS